MDGYVKEMRRKIGTDMLMFAGAGIFLYQDGKILLQRRRELFEETGLAAG